MLYDLGSLLIGGSILILCIVFLYMWIRAERKIKKLKQ